MSEHRCRRYVDGLTAVPWDLIRDPDLGLSTKVAACGLAALRMPRSAEVGACTAEIGRACGLSRRAVQEGIAALIEAGWVAREGAVNLVGRRYVLLWLIPDDFEGLVPHFAGAARAVGGAARPCPGGGTS